ncbi:hypothetical protein [Streptomyces sp. 8N616]|uniref:hypothetical protein n=1 Tax=Streptomyces sp. 8N616 TaxID=3457414 RepID=UPI003FD52D76
MERASNAHGSNVRTAALAGAAVLALVLPLAAATAGPAGRGSDRRDRTEAPPAAPSISVPAAPAENPEDAENAQDADGKAVGGAGRGGSTVAARGASALLPDLGLTGTSRCGPELTSPEGVEAQTCVLREGRDTWGRTYYRNATGRTLQAVLSLMRPDGRTVQVYCTLDAKDDPGACETPRAPGWAAGATPTGQRAAEPGETAGGAAERTTEQGEGESQAYGAAAYGAVAEIAAADSDRLLLRSGSNSPYS